MTKYLQIRNDPYRLALRETDDCGVMSLALVLGISYQEAHEALKAEGRKNGKATFPSQIVKAANNLGFKMEVLPSDHRYYTCRTLRSLQKKILSGNFLVYTTGHFSAVIDCEVEDWAKDSCKRIGGKIKGYGIYKVEKA